ncbi:hypothetical protein CC2G_011442 [Coprinopsis cinerea AmutBmut pab1-1]|nr:hypothetical protein CC2G_011442 [Coprinopsis cinerea AmutBmut pab1-1]
MFASRSLYPASRRPLHNAFSKRNNILKKSYSSSQAAARTTDPGPERRQTHSRHPAQGHDSLLGRTHRHSTTDAVKKSLRDLLRETAQPVAVVTSLMPENERQNCQFHGATLSSFTSISMHPHPLVAFALRIPSRMASTLTSLAPPLAPPQSAPSSVPGFEHRPKSPSDAHMVINILSHTQADIAHRFSRPDLFPQPFSSTPYSLTKDGLPILHDSLGAISCRLVARPLKLSELGGKQPEEAEGERQPQEATGVVSELFIARVLRVESLPKGEKEDKPLSPLLYHRRSYTTC